MTPRYLLVGCCLWMAAGPVLANPPAVAPAARAAAEAVQAAEPAVAAPTATAPAKAKPVAAGPKRAVAAADKLELDTTQITGNRELPKVMVIVPWKRSDIGELAGRPGNSLIDEALRPVDREVFRRELSYYQALAAGGVPAEAAPAVPKRADAPEK